MLDFMSMIDVMVDVMVTATGTGTGNNNVSYYYFIETLFPNQNFRVLI